MTRDEHTVQVGRDLARCGALTAQSLADRAHFTVGQARRWIRRWARERLIFPVGTESTGTTGPPRVVWGSDTGPFLPDGWTFPGEEVDDE